MKISKLFHWLYFIVMMLPIFTIPIFAIYSHRHTIDTYSVQAEETKVVDFNQLLPLDLFLDTQTVSGVTFTNNNDGSISVVGTASDNISEFRLFKYPYVQYNANNMYLFYNLPGISGVKYGVQGFGTTKDSSFIFNYASRWIQSLNISITSGSTVNFKFYLMITNLTQMFGSGNEPTVEVFNSWYNADYYEYTLSDKQLLKTGNYITYNDTDIGSQLIYDTYNVVNKYFNYDKVFNFGDLYSWLNLTFFNGGASLGFFIFWHFLIYWLLTSLLWLLFDVLMYVPQLVHRWLDKASIS